MAVKTRYCDCTKISFHYFSSFTSVDHRISISCREPESFQYSMLFYVITFCMPLIIRSWAVVEFLITPSCFFKHKLFHLEFCLFSGEKSFRMWLTQLPFQLPFFLYFIFIFIFYFCNSLSWNGLAKFHSRASHSTLLTSTKVYGWLFLRVYHSYSTTSSISLLFWFVFW